MSSKGIEIGFGVAVAISIISSSASYIGRTIERNRICDELNAYYPEVKLNACKED